MSQILYFFRDLSLILLLAPPQIFVFSVTLLGNALESSEQEEKLARENEIADIYEKIEKLMKATKEAKKTKDTSAINRELDILRDQQKLADGKIKEIRSKYERIHFKNLILYPSISLLLVAFINSLAIIYISDWSYLWLVFIFDAILLFIGMRKVYLALLLIQEISINRKESQLFSRLKDTIVSALRQDKEEDAPEAIVNFEAVQFPLGVEASSERALRFLVKLVKGDGLENVFVWFFFPDGFELIAPGESEMWRQSASSFVPNYKTVKVGVKDLVPEVSNPGDIKFRVPKDKGNYSVWYNVVAKKYAGDPQEIVFVVNP